MFKQFLQNNIVLLDGAMGTELIKRGLKVGQTPELFNITSPQVVTDVHKSYIDSGSRVVYANTFGANSQKFTNPCELEKAILAAIDCARAAAGATNFVALDIGPTGELLEPLGAFSFDDAYSCFAQVINIAKDKVDLIAIETMSSLNELKAALLAARENCTLPVIATMSFEENLRTFTGCTVSSFALTASPFADAIGINCSLGPDKMLPIVTELTKWTTLPIIVKANAGMPDENGCYNQPPSEFLQTYKTFMQLGVRVIGGCCGTTPMHIKLLSDYIKDLQPVQINSQIPCAVCSENKTVVIDGVKIIGERINPTGKKLLKAALTTGDFEYVKEQAVIQSPYCDILDINVGLADIDERANMIPAVKEVQSVTDCPLQIDSNDLSAIEAGLRYTCGKAIVNSVNGETKNLNAVLPLVKKYGAAVIGLTIDQNGIPKTAQKRLQIAKKILKYAKKYKIDKQNVFIDCLTLTVSAEQEQANQTLLAIRGIKKLGLKTVLGVSNISFGLPERQKINTAFLTCALACGLDMPILNPNIKENQDALNAFKVLSGQDKNSATYISLMTQAQVVEEQTDDIFYSILNGLSRTGELVKNLAKTCAPLDIVNLHLIPALDKIGIMFESGKIFLPQLIAAAESAKLGFDQVKLFLDSGSGSRGKIVLATVKGDIHDIGKNIVKVVLQNYGYDIIDLGKNVDEIDILNCVVKNNITLVGLSALMTTTAANMKSTVALLKEKVPSCKIMVGGAVITQEFAKKINADFYAKDANDAVKIAKQVFI